MALSFTTGATISLNTTFRDRVAVAMFYVAREIIATPENPEDGYESRRDLAREIIKTTHEELRRYSTLVLTDDTIRTTMPNGSVDQTLITDNHITAAIRNAWNGLANVRLG